MDATGSQVLQAEPAASVRWEPCPEPTVDDAGSICSACGWPVDDHELEPAIIVARAA